MAANPADLESVRSSCPKARILIGSGADVQNVREYAALADGFIVGSSLKTGGKISAPVDLKRVAAFATALRNIGKLKRRGNYHANRQRLRAVANLARRTR
jgi:predicted TIM-barrel enzyme